jgi:hypothetical protein
MKSKLLSSLAICSLVAVLSTGCTTQKTRTGRNTNVLGGLVTCNTGDYAPISPLGADANVAIGRVNPSGTQVSLLWGAVNLHDY